MMILLVCFTALLLIFFCGILNKHKKYLRMQQEQKTLIHLLEEGVLILNSSYTGIECNRALCRILGVKSSDLLKHDFFSLEATVHRGVLEKCQHLLKQVRMASCEVRESMCYQRGGEPCALDIMAACLDHNQYVLVLKDSSQDYQTFKMGKEFIANASHELRTPITIIKGFIETLQDLPEVSDAMLEDIFEKILRSCTRMDDIVKNLLILTDLDHSFKTHMQSVDVVALLDNCRHSILEIYPDVTVEMTGTMQKRKQAADPSLLELAIMNLLQNAVKYSPAPAQIGIQLREEEGEFFISIADHGYGIPEENRAHIFERFYSVNKTVSRRLGGAGLGLSIVKNIVEKHQGSIMVEDHPAGGTVFTLAFPSD